MGRAIGLVFGVLLSEVKRQGAVTDSLMKLGVSSPPTPLTPTRDRHPMSNVFVHTAKLYSCDAVLTIGNFSCYNVTVMKKPTKRGNPQQTAVRISVGVRERLRRHCELNGLKMRPFVDKVISEAILSAKGAA